MDSVPCRGKDRGRAEKIGNKKAFSLIELLVVMLIMGAIAGASCLVFADGKDSDRTVREEADKFSLWLTEMMSMAQMEECGFKLSMSQKSTGNASFRLTWQGGPRHGSTEMYESSKARIFPQNGNLSTARIFDGEWGSMTPAVTLDVKPTSPGSAKTLYIVVSGAGCVSVRDKAN